MSQPCVLIVQNDPATSLLLAVSIARSGGRPAGLFYTVAEASNWLNEDSPDAAVLDIELRDGSVLPIAHQCRVRQVPILLCASRAQVDQLPPQFRDAAFVEKPIQFEAILMILPTLIRGRQVSVVGA